MQISCVILHLLTQICKKSWLHKSFFLLFFLQSCFQIPFYNTSSWLYPALSIKEAFLRGKSWKTGGNLRGEPEIRRGNGDGKEKKITEQIWSSEFVYYLLKVWKEAKKDHRGKQFSHANCCTAYINKTRKSNYYDLHFSGIRINNHKKYGGI